MTETPQGQQPEDEPYDPHGHHLRDELHRLEDEAYVKSVRWGPVALGVLLAVLLVVIAVAGYFWLA